MRTSPSDTPSVLKRLGLLGSRLSWLAVVPMLVLLVWLAWSGRHTQQEIRAASQRAVRIAELQDTIVNLNAWLAMLAQVAASTGEHRWVDRYDEAAAKLDAAILEAGGLATPQARAALASTMGEAHRDLDVMERRAMALAVSGDREAARTLLNGPAYAYLEEVYANGSNVFVQELTAIANKRATDLDARNWFETAGLGLSAILLGATALSVRGRRRLQGALAKTAAAAGTDTLTDLPNRRRFYEELETALATGRRYGLDHALLLIDLDRFKAANDAYGHPAGDELLRLVAARLRHVLRDEGRIARLGGDEFAFVLCCDPAGPDQPRADPEAVADRIVHTLSQPFALTSGAIIQIGASIGIGLTTAEDTAIDELMHRADVALYRAKADGRGCSRLFEPGMDALVRARALLEGELRQAIADDVIVPHFQPLVDIGTGQLVGVEMLARWPHPVHGMVPPDQFIPIAEDLGLIGALTEQLLRRACRAAAAWPSEISLACNVSPVQLRDPNLPAMIQGVLSETGFPASRIEIEVTESALVGDLDLARGLLDQLRALGVRLALDDFGTGYSSLRHLQTLPFDKIKIDRSFVTAMAEDPESAKIVSAVLGLGRSLGLATVAEGIETEKTATFLRDLGCEIGQGWLFGRPISAELTHALVGDRRGTEDRLPLVA